jgi:hypothetical protein
MVLAVVGEVGCGLAMKWQLQGKSVRLRGPCGAPLASIPPPTVAVVTPLPQRPIKQGQGTVNWCSSERLWCKLSRVGKRSGVADKVCFIGFG